MELAVLNELESVVQRLKAQAQPVADPVELTKRVTALQKRVDHLEREAEGQRNELDDFMCATVFLCGTLFCVMMLFHTAILKKMNMLMRPIHIVASRQGIESVEAKSNVA